MTLFWISHKTVANVRLRGKSMIYAQRKMPQYFYENSEPDMPHWCVALIPDDEQATVTFLPGSQRLTLEQAEKKAEELNQKLSH